MIFTLTPNPALDLSGTVRKLVPNEKNYVQGFAISPGGNAINAARIIARLGGPVVAGGFLGGGVGQELEGLLLAEGVDCRFIRIAGDTRVSVNVSHAGTDLQTRLCFPGPTISRVLQNRLLQQVRRLPRGSFVLLGGSFPPGVESGFVERLKRIVRSRGQNFLIDVPGAALQTTLRVGADFAKPNLVEFQTAIGRRVSSIGSILKAARPLTRRIPWLCISSVEGGALLVSRHRAWFGNTPKIKIRTTVGAGDAMVGAMTYFAWKQLHSTSSTLAQEDSPEFGANLLRWGLASACATLSVPGTCSGSAKAIRSYLSRISIQAIESQ
jgi:1-phosphofructokinase family hexose kinase